MMLNHDSPAKRYPAIICAALRELTQLTDKETWDGLFPGGELSIQLHWSTVNAVEKYTGALVRMCWRAKAADWAYRLIAVGPRLAMEVLLHCDPRLLPVPQDFWREAGLDDSAKRYTRSVAESLVARLSRPAGWKYGQDDIRDLAGLANRTVSRYKGNVPASRQELISWLQEMPYSPSLRAICSQIGDGIPESKDVLGSIYQLELSAERKRNSSGGNAQYASRWMLGHLDQISDEEMKAYRAGKLPERHMMARARRAATRWFLAEFHRLLLEEQRPEQEKDVCKTDETTRP
jgi:hypothetical protein